MSISTVILKDNQRTYIKKALILVGNSLTNSCTIDGVKYTKLGRITNASLYYIQHNWDKTNNEASRVIAQQVLIYLESADKNNWNICQKSEKRC